MLDRRKFLIDTSLALATGARCIPNPAPQGLRDSASCSPWLIGGAVTVAQIVYDAPLAARFVQEFGIVTPAMELKWQTVHPGPELYRFDLADRFISWAQANRMAVRGHNLVWPNYGTPKWVTEYLTPTNVRTVLEEHIRTVAGRYAGKIHSWDVINEGLNVWDKRSDLLAAHPWVELMGPQYIDLAFHTAAAADPHARLIWNQNYIELDDAGDEQNRIATLAQLRRLKKANVPIHGLGIQSHITAGKPLSAAALERFLGEVAALGLEVQLTELDVNDTGLPLDIECRDLLVADTYKRYLELILRCGTPSLIVFWTPCDKQNWYDWASKSNPKYARPDGAPHRPGLFDSDLRDKPAYFAVRTALLRT
jgi:endo-1,4-beta-xylanase